MFGCFGLFYVRLGWFVLGCLKLGQNELLLVILGYVGLVYVRLR